ncbi:HNH endonuclease [Agrococcus terreus]|uniref:HNH endonuclease signature motif containing protein n=1 Tax=Agrococcus terreus TaxID=574649 RepID=UPI00384F0399
MSGAEAVEAARAGLVPGASGAAVRALEDALDAAEAAWVERLMALDDAEVAAIADRGGMLPRRADGADASSPLSPAEAVQEELVLLRAESARIAARERELLAQAFAASLAAGGDARVAVRETASELACELRLGDTTIERRMVAAHEVVRDLPLAHAAHRDGTIDAAHLAVIVRATEALRLDDHVVADDRHSVDRRHVEEALVAIAQQTTPGRLRRRAARIVDAALARPLQQRHEAARERRGVSLDDAGDGMARLTAVVPAVLGGAILDRLTQGAAAKPKDDPRTFAQWRADALCELLLAGAAPDDVHRMRPIRPVVAVTIPVSTLVGGHVPAVLDSGALLDPATARAIAADAGTWDRLLLAGGTGAPIAVDAYRPSAAQRRWLRHRDGRCRWPGCANPVTRADADHTHDHALGGATDVRNLAHLCRRHHTMKHATGWRVRQRAGGVLEWTSPAGRLVVDEPEPPPGPLSAGPPDSPRGPRFVDASAEPRRASDLWSPEPQTATALGPPPF